MPKTGCGETMGGSRVMGEKNVCEICGEELPDEPFYEDTCDDCSLHLDLIPTKKA